MHVTIFLALFAISALAAPVQDSDHGGSDLIGPFETSVQDTSALVTPIEDPIKDVAVLEDLLGNPLDDFPEENNNDNGTATLSRRGPDNCYQTGTSWKPNNGEVIQLMNDVCLKDMGGNWKKNEKVSKCLPGRPFS